MSRVHQSLFWGVEILLKMINFVKPFLKGKFLRPGEWERGKLYFDHHFSFLTVVVFLKR